MNAITSSSVWRTILTLLLPILALVTVDVGFAMAQTPTPEGTTIQNVATAGFTDANGNSYTDVADTVSITVGFQGGLDLTAPADVTPAAGATNQTLAFSILNGGNGTDTLAVDSLTFDAAVVENVSYIYKSTPYANIGLLNAALAADSIAADSTVTITVEYDVVSGSAGLNSDVTLFTSSTRTGGNSDSDATNVAPPLTGTVTVADPADASRLPSNGTSYTMTFSVTSGLTGTDTLALKAVSSNSNAVITLVEGVAGDSVNSTFTAGQNKTITVTYTVADVAAGSTADITLTAGAILGATSDNSAGTVTVIRPSLAITKGAFTDAAATTAVSGDVFPGDTIYYKIEITNGGTATATSVSVTDDLPTAVTFDAIQSTAGVAWTTAPAHNAVNPGGTVSAAITSLSSVGGSNAASFIIRVIIN